ncbi:class I SAM-dependent methyltransferase [Texcoconibacillus texcoconensis]|uniref:Ubiquinone/menaquinone biosynthesis C-methylase UbiE n=1 Tax=Texcoconibacillus texcoconensis TaxID=1095777 RepID=A0A840QS01_9BACI|nr:class I SAM-dependent methyltransferase [Texcoconibacillus texcoconensis]MBB5174276.1 ubiquinone/menaquinone biosynthesis C-methylase UbiE [Texcoconibacillus texcoconensis]
MLRLELPPVLYDRFVRPKWVTEAYIHRCVEEHTPLSQRTVLDFGAGTGSNCVLCSPDQYLGVDPNHERVNYAKTVYPNYQFKPLSGNQLPIESQSIDTIMIIAVLHHIDPKEMPNIIEEFRRVLKPENRQIIVIEPCIYKKCNISNWFMRTFDKGRYIQDQPTYLSYFENEGFTCEVKKMFSKCLFYNELFFVAH